MRRPAALECYPMQIETTLWIGWTLLGAILGSFLNAAIYRWPRGISLIKKTRSFCPSCQATIAWYDNIPILSYLILRGRCRSCRWRIPIRYLLVELITAGLFALAYYRGRIEQPERLGLPFVLAASFIVADLVAISFIDIETYTVPLAGTWALICVGLSLSVIFPVMQLAPTAWTGIARVDSFLNSLEGAILGGGLVWATGAFAELVMRKEAMGGGDVKILAGTGALLGWKAAIAAFFIAPFLGTFVGVPMLLAARLRKGKSRQDGITYRYEPDEAPPSDEELVKSRRLLLLGFALALEQVACLWLLPGARAAPAASAPFYFGATLGFFMAFYDVTRRRLVREGRWIRRDIRRSEDGATEEHLSGNYLPFGPFLAVSALVMLFAGDEVLRLAARRLFPF